MEKETQPLWVRIKNGVINNYFNLTFYYLAVYGVISMVMVYGVDYLMDGNLDYGNIKNEMLITTITFMMTMATMIKKLKDDIVSNYWRQQKQINQRRGKK